MQNTSHSNPFVREPQFYSFTSNPSKPWFVNKQNRRHYYLYANTSSPVILQVGEYQALVVPPEQWIYFPFPDNFKVTQFLPTYAVTLSTITTDEVMSSLSSYVGGYNVYARSEQAFGIAAIYNAVTVGTWAAMQISTPNNSQATVIVDKIIVDSLSVPTRIVTTQGTVPDVNITGVPAVSNHRLDGPIHNISSVAVPAQQGGLASFANTIDISITPYFGETNVLQGDVRIIPKLYKGVYACYVQSSSAANPITINMSWHEEL